MIMSRSKYERDSPSQRRCGNPSPGIRYIEGEVVSLCLPLIETMFYLRLARSKLGEGLTRETKHAERGWPAGPHLGRIFWAAKLPFKSPSFWTPNLPSWKGKEDKVREQWLKQERTESWGWGSPELHACEKYITLIKGGIPYILDSYIQGPAFP